MGDRHAVEPAGSHQIQTQRLSDVLSDALPLGQRGGSQIEYRHQRARIDIRQNPGATVGELVVPRALTMLRPDLTRQVSQPWPLVPLLQQCIDHRLEERDPLKVRCLVRDRHLRVRGTVTVTPEGVSQEPFDVLDRIVEDERLKLLGPRPLGKAPHGLQAG